jgi:cell division protein FtsX
MNVVWSWLRLDLRRRWQSLAVLTVLVAVAGGLVMASFAGARRAVTVQERLSKDTLPATAAVLPNTPGFDWAPVRNLPEVASVAPFIVDYAMAIEGVPGESIGFPFVGDDFSRTIEKPIIYSGRTFDPSRADEALVSRQFVTRFHKGVGDTVVLRLPTPQEILDQRRGGPAELTGPRVTVHIVGVAETPFMLSDAPGQEGVIEISPGLVAQYPENTLGDQSNPDNPNHVNAIVRLRGGEADIPILRKDITRLTGRSDIDIWDRPDQAREAQRHIVFEARCLVALGIAAFIAAVFLIGQAIARYVAANTAELQALRALGLTPRQSIITASAGPAVVGVVGAALAAIAATIGSNWTPIGEASLIEPNPGTSLDWVVLGPGIAVILLLVAAAGLATAALALGASRRAQSGRRSAVATSVARAGLAVPVIVGTRFALEAGRGRTALPVRPALIGAATGVLGILGAFTFSHGVSDAASHPERFGQTFQVGAFIGSNDQNFGPVDELVAALQSNPNVTGVDDARTAVATGPGGMGSISLYVYVGGAKQIPVVLMSGRMPQAADEVVLGPTTMTALHAHVGESVPLAGSSGTATFTVTGTGLVVAGPHNGYADGGWMTPAGYDSIFDGFKYRLILVTLRPDARTPQAATILHDQVAAANPDLKDVVLQRPPPLPEFSALQDVRVLPVVLGIFLALLAIGAVGHALATAVRRRSHDLAVLRALGMTQWQCRWVVVTQATVLAIVGLVFGVPLGLAVGRSLWRTVADYTPLQYTPPLAVWALLLVGPAVLVTANLLAAWPGQRAARLRIAHILRTE